MMEQFDSSEEESNIHRASIAYRLSIDTDIGDLE